jgi:hypothetical protein
MELSVLYASSICFNSFSVNSFTSSLSAFEITFVGAFSEVPEKLTLSMHGIHVPLTVVERAFVELGEAAVVVSFTIDPFTLVDVSIWMGKSSFTIVYLILSLSLIESSILKFDLTESFPLSHLLTKHLSLISVFGAIWVGLVSPVVVPDVECSCLLIDLSQLLPCHHCISWVFTLSDHHSVDDAWFSQICDLSKLSFFHDC